MQAAKTAACFFCFGKIVCENNVKIRQIGLTILEISARIDNAPFLKRKITGGD